ncbi:unnamed protein product [Timema podura]|uniref:Uncharacterized protein n=1 Tax=Timema podura TaxID=61482 RepID=A0ABN7P5Z3_TIMPD|nr:unnamed protein product [Timema podura]
MVYGLADLLKCCRHLRKLSIEHCTVNKDVCTAISLNSNLEVLNLSACYGLTEDSINTIITGCRNSMPDSCNADHHVLSLLCSMLTHASLTLMPESYYTPYLIYTSLTLMPESYYAPYLTHASLTLMPESYYAPYLTHTRLDHHINY